VADLIGDVCQECGQVHEKCTGHKKHVVPKRPCRANPRAGSPVCDSHGGAAPQVKAKAASRVQEQLAASAAARFALPVQIGPAEGLLAEVHRTAGAIAWLEAQIIRVTGDAPDTLIRGTRSLKRTETEDGTFTTTEVGPGVHDWLQLWQRERQHFVQVCRVTLAAGIEQKRVDLARDQAQQVVTVLKGVFADLGLSPAQEAMLGVVVPKHLRLVQTPA
jgi:hypothetical protein